MKPRRGRRCSPPRLRRQCGEHLEEPRAQSVHFDAAEVSARRAREHRADLGGAHVRDVDESASSSSARSSLTCGCRRCAVSSSWLMRRPRWRACGSSRSTWRASTATDTPRTCGIHQRRSSCRRRCRGRRSIWSPRSKILAAWKLSHWERIYGRAPTIDDLIVPTRNMTPIDPKDANEAFKRDLAALGLRVGAGAHRDRGGARPAFVVHHDVPGARGSPRPLARGHAHGERRRGLRLHAGDVGCVLRRGGPSCGFRLSTESSCRLLQCLLQRS